MSSLKLYLSDFKSGFYVFLIALPLSLGIATASGFPAIAGVYTAVIGGVISSFFGSSRLTIKGPAAGLIVIVLGAVQELGQGSPVLGYHRALAVGAAAAVIQIILSLMKAGRLGALMPPSVVHGMLAGIGVIIFAKQIHLMLGVVPVSKTPFQLLSEIPHSIANEDLFITLFGLISILGLVFFPKIKLLNRVPAALLNLLIVVPLGLFLHLSVSHSERLFGKMYELGPQFLVHIPLDPFSSFAMPDWSALKMLAGWKFVIMFALVGSIESLLTVAAVDSLDPERRPSDLDKDLMAVGVGNLVSAMVGGLPMISEIVRSKANIDNGAKGVSSNLIHGLLLALSMFFLPSYINMIPLSALAAMLVVTGYRLASPFEFIKVYKVGADQLCLFLTTLFVTLMSNLLDGVIVGILLKMAIHTWRSVRPREFFVQKIQIVDGLDSIFIVPQGPCVFTNLIQLMNTIGEIEKKAKNAKKKIILDLSQARYVDHTTLEKLHLIKKMSSVEISMIGTNTMKGVSAHELATRRTC